MYNCLVWMGISFPINYLVGRRREAYLTCIKILLFSEICYDENLSSVFASLEARNMIHFVLLPFSFLS